MMHTRPPGSRPTRSGDALFVPVTHALVVDPQVSHAAFRLWCVLHRLRFLHETPAMARLQELMGCAVTRAGAPAWRPATRRSVERWLGELEAAGWLRWTRRAAAAERYHLHTGDRSAGDHAGAVTPDAPRAITADATGRSQHPPAGARPTAASQGATNTSHPAIGTSHGAIGTSQDAIPASHPAIGTSHDPTPTSHHATVASDQGAPELTLLRQSRTARHENQRHETHGDPPPPPPGGGGGGATATEQLLIRAGFSARTAREFGDLDCAVAQAEIARRLALGQGPGAIVQAWRRVPPGAPDAPPQGEHPAVQAKRAALAIAPADADECEIQYLALDLEEGTPAATALARLAARRATAAGAL